MTQNNSLKIPPLAAIARQVGQNVENNKRQTDSVVEYFRRLKAGEDTGSEKQIIEGNLHKWRLFNWNIDPRLQSAKRTIVDWSKNHIDGGGLILAGDCGCGKSHIAAAIADARGPLARFVNEVDLIKSIQATYGGGREGITEESILRRYQETPLLIYDDLGTYDTKSIEWLQAIYYALFNGRKEGGKATIITTNLPLIDHAGNSPLEARVGERTFSRILGQVGSKEHFIDLFGVPDYRLKNFE